MSPRERLLNSVRLYYPSLLKDSSFMSNVNNWLRQERNMVDVLDFMISVTWGELTPLDVKIIARQNAQNPHASFMDNLELAALESKNIQNMLESLKKTLESGDLGTFTPSDRRKAQIEALLKEKEEANK